MPKKGPHTEEVIEIMHVKNGVTRLAYVGILSFAAKRCNLSPSVLLSVAKKEGNVEPPKRYQPPYNPRFPVFVPPTDYTWDNPDRYYVRLYKAKAA